MKKICLFATLVVAMFITSCGTSSHLTHNRNINETTVELNQKNFTVKRTVQGQATATYVLGIGGLSKRAMQSNAQAEMMKNANLKGAEIVINPTLEVKRINVLPFYQKVQITSYGYVIEFTE